MTAAVIEELDAVGAYLDMARELLTSGVMPDITDLEKRVEDMCRRIQQADEKVREQCVPKMEALLHNLAACERGMHAWRDAAMKTGTGDDPA